MVTTYLTCGRTSSIRFFSGKDESSLLKTQIAQGSFGAIPKTTTTHGQARAQAQPIPTSKKAKKRKGKGGAKTHDDQPPAKTKSEFNTGVHIFCSSKGVTKASGDHLSKFKIEVNKPSPGACLNESR